MFAAWAATLVVAAWSFQDPPPSPAPVPPPPPKEAQEPKGLPARDPLEGVYGLTGRTVAGHPDPNRSRGYLAITNRHMLLVFAAAGTDPDAPLLRAGVRRWQKATDGRATVDATIQLGFFTDADGEIHVEEPGTREVRRIQLVRGGLRVWQDDDSFLDFERLE